MEEVGTLSEILVKIESFMGDGLIMSCWRCPKNMHSKKLGMSGGPGPAEQKRAVEHQFPQMC